LIVRKRDQVATIILNRPGATRFWLLAELRNVLMRSMQTKLVVVLWDLETGVFDWV
jgi:hypothetical protein